MDRKVQDTFIHLSGALVGVAGGLGLALLLSSSRQSQASSRAVSSKVLRLLTAAQGSGSKCSERGEVEAANHLVPGLRRHITCPIFYRLKQFPTFCWLKQSIQNSAPLFIFKGGDIDSASAWEEGPGGLVAMCNVPYLRVMLFVVDPLSLLNLQNCCCGPDPPWSSHSSCLSPDLPLTGRVD